MAYVPQKPLSNATNVCSDNRICLPTPPQDVGCKRKIPQLDETSTKRLKIVDQAENDSDDDSDIEMEPVDVLNTRTRRHTMFNLLKTASFRPPTVAAPTILPSRRILQSFVSSYKFDVYTCHSYSDTTFVAPPYACAYSHGAKRNGTPYLAVATEEGSAIILKTSGRKGWDHGYRQTLRPHCNGIFNIKWGPDDSVLATASGDKTTHITSVETTETIQVLRGHSSTVKCIAWDPSHPDLLSTGGRDGNIYLWDLRVTNNSGTSPAPEEDFPTSYPVVAINVAHGQEKSKGGRKKAQPSPRGVTGLVYTNAHTLVSSGSFDGQLNMWDLRQPEAKSASKRTKKPVPMAPACTSPVDPTVLHGARRPRGLMSLCAGSGPSAGLLFALGADNRIHAYDSSTLISVDSFTHPNLLSSFYVHLASSPCGRWLASGCAGKNGSLLLYDISNAGRLSASPRTRGPTESLTASVELRGQTGEIGAVDWANNMVASCADDRTVRVWRPDLDVYQNCIAHPEDNVWEWEWSSGIYPR